MEPDVVKKMIEGGLPECQVQVDGDGSHFDAIVVGDVFDGKSPVQRQQLVYGTLGDNISNGNVHALSIKTFTCAEWDAANTSGL